LLQSNNRYLKVFHSVRNISPDLHLAPLTITDFFPNNDKSPARRFRITKALEYGASWIQEWQIGITHIIVDRDLDYEHLLKYLKIDSLPVSSAPSINIVSNWHWEDGIILVDEAYPADCLSFRFLLDPHQIQYRVKGYNTTNLPKPSSLPEGCINKSILTSKLTAEVAALPQGQRVSRQIEIASKADHCTDRDSAPAPGNNNTIRERGNVQGEAEQKLGTQTGRDEHVALSKSSQGLWTARKSPIENSLSSIVENVKQLQHFTLEEEEDRREAYAMSDDGSDAALETTTSVGSTVNRSEPMKMTDSHWQDKFRCMKASDRRTSDSGPNARTIEVLEQMGQYYDAMRDRWRATAYRRAVTVLKQQSQKITLKEQAIALPFVGERLAAKIEEIVFTNNLRRLENAQLEPHHRAIQLFLDIYGVGFETASFWARQGFKTLDDLLEHAHLSANQRVGIAHYEDFKTRIPRAEVTEHGRIVCTALQSLDPGFSVIIGGSYRRGARDCGDIDCIITHPTHSLSAIRTIVIDTLVPQLFEQDYIKASLASADSFRATGTKWHGAAALPVPTPLVGAQKKPKLAENPWRRIDFLLVPSEELGAALIYFTGNDIFNRSIRLLASKKHMRLNQYGLYKHVLRGPERSRVTEGERVEGRDERSIFEILGVPWRAPEERNCWRMLNIAWMVDKRKQNALKLNPTTQLLFTK
jgi:DNA polymerase IV